MLFPCCSKIYIHFEHFLANAKVCGCTVWVSFLKVVFKLGAPTNDNIRKISSYIS